MLVRYCNLVLKRRLHCRSLLPPSPSRTHIYLRESRLDNANDQCCRTHRWYKRTSKQLYQTLCPLFQRQKVSRDTQNTCCTVMLVRFVGLARFGPEKILNLFVAFLLPRSFITKQHAVRRHSCPEGRLYPYWPTNETWASAGWYELGHPLRRQQFSGSPVRYSLTQCAVNGCFRSIF